MLGRTYDLMEKLVSYPTVSGTANGEFINAISGYLGEFGVNLELLPDPTGKKFSLSASIGPMREGGVVLSGHGDVVTAEGQAWTSDPFTLVQRDNRLVARGSVDMKGFLAVILAKVPEMLSADLRHPFHIAISFDEETTGEGGELLVDHYAKNMPPVRAVLIGEPTNMKVLNAHKGANCSEVTVTGQGAHSALMENGYSAISMAAHLVTLIEDMVEENRHNAVPGAFDPNYTTWHVGQIHGGTAINLLAEKCIFNWDLRLLPDDDASTYTTAFDAKAARILERAHKIAPSCGITRTEVFDTPPLRLEVNGTAEQLCRKLLNTEETIAGIFSTEAPYFQSAGFSVVVVGPGDTSQVHLTDEYITIEQIERCENFIDKLITELSG